MNLDLLPLTETEKQRNAWFAERARSGMPMDEYIRLNDEARRIFPTTAEERENKLERFKAVSGFVL